MFWEDGHSFPIVVKLMSFCSFIHVHSGISCLYFGMDSYVLRGFRYLRLMCVGFL